MVEEVITCIGGISWRIYRPMPLCKRNTRARGPVPAVENRSKERIKTFLLELSSREGFRAHLLCTCAIDFRDEWWHRVTGTKAAGYGMEREEGERKRGGGKVVYLFGR